MKQWKAIASANNLSIPTPDLDRITPALDALEEAFRPLAEALPADIEPALLFEVEEGE